MSQVVEVSVTVAARLETVWSFLSDDTKFAAWIGSFAGMGPQRGTKVEARVGGSLRVEYPDTGAGPAVALGQIVAIEPMKRIVFTWGNESGPGIEIRPGSTSVEIELSPAADGVLVTLRHSGLPSEESRRAHYFGWTHYITMLAKNAAESQVFATLAPVLDGYYGAWRETDPARRRTLLEKLCTPRVHVRTGFASTDSIPELDAHIGNSLKHMPGMALVAAGNPVVSHNFILSPWAVQTSDGNPIFRGTNVLTLAPDGRVRQVTSFPA